PRASSAVAWAIEARTHLRIPLPLVGRGKGWGCCAGLRDPREGPPVPSKSTDPLPVTGEGMMVDAVAKPPRQPGALKRFIERYPFVPALVIMLVLLALNGIWQPRSVSLVGITGLIKTYMALMLLAVAQTYVVYAGDIDLSAGAIVSLVNVVIVAIMAAMGDSGASVFTAMAAGLGVGLACGIVN